MFVNPLDRVPQIPQDWANHIVYGGIGGLLALLILLCVGIGLNAAALYAAIFVFALAVVKKTVDFFREGESLEICVGKAVVTALWPATLLMIVLLPRALTT